MIDAYPPDHLAFSLLSIAADPSRTRQLYGVLREFCHVVRNRLSSVKIALYLARLDSSPDEREEIERLEELYAGIERFLDQLQSIVKPVQLDPIELGLGDILEDRRCAWSSWLGERHVHLDWSRPADEPSGFFDHGQLGPALDAFVCWRAESASPDSHVRVSWGTDGSGIRMAWHEPSAKLVKDLTPPEEQPVSLTLVYLARIVVVHRGELSIDEAEDGLRIRIRWPLASGQAHPQSRAS